MNTPELEQAKTAEMAAELERLRNAEFFLREALDQLKTEVLCLPSPAEEDHIERLISRISGIQDAYFNIHASWQERKAYEDGINL